MPKFTAVVVETVAVEVLYEIEADNMDKAREMAESGNTVTERKLRDQGVLNREIIEIEEDASSLTTIG